MHTKTFLVLLGACAGIGLSHTGGALAQTRANQPSMAERGGSGIPMSQDRNVRNAELRNERFAANWFKQSRYADPKLQEAVARNDYAYMLAHYQKKCQASDLPSNVAQDDYDRNGSGVGNCHYLAELYWNGLGVPRDTARAIAYYQMAADGGFWPSVEFLAKTYLKGDVVPRDADKAIALLTRFTTKPKTSTALTCISAMHLASIYQTGAYVLVNGAEAAKWYRHCIDRLPPHADPTREVIRAMTHLADLYDDGDLVPADPAEAAKLYGKILDFKDALAADRTNAQFHLGAMYVEGRGGRKDAVRGIGLLTAAAKAGQPDASLALYKLYSTGQDVEANPALAAHYLRIAADLNQLEAQYLMARQSLTATPPALAEARAWFESASAQGYRDAQYELGQFHIQHPDGGDKSLINAWVWFDLAAQNGHPLAAQARDDVAKRLMPEELTRAKALEANLKAKFPGIAPA